MSSKTEKNRVSLASNFAEQSALPQTSKDGNPACRLCSSLGTAYSIFALSVAALFLLPLLGAYFTEATLAFALIFPPTSRAIPIEGFSWPVFISISAVLSFFVITPLWQIINTKATTKHKTSAREPLPLWGFLGLAVGALFWLISWTRFELFASIQKHTFLFLWISFLIIVSALSQIKTGKAPHKRYQKVFYQLFPLSALLWWAFEFVNRFAQNWSYHNVENFSSLEFFFYATLSFSTVLPALLATRDILTSYPRLHRAFIRARRLRIPTSRPFWFAVLLSASVFLALIPLFPNNLYPFVWVSPLLIIWALKIFTGLPTMLSPLKHGDWREIFFWGAAGLVCGFFWEMWNFYSLAKWVYHIPYVQILHVFEMPLLGYGGYIPFGWFSGEIIALFITPQLAAKKQGRQTPNQTQNQTRDSEELSSDHLSRNSSQQAILIPTHLAIIMDGNGRWAEMRGLPRTKGHQAGALAVDRVVEESRRLGIRYLTLFAFSSENWRRPRPEVSALMSLFADYLKREITRLKNNGIRLRAMGDLSRLPRRVSALLEEAQSETSHLRDMDLILAVSYGSRGELTHALQRISEKILKGELKYSEIGEEDISKHLYLPDLPDPDLIIRTSNEIRLSNFLLWQAAYSEIVVRDVLWPDFDKNELLAALGEFARRERRFGMLSPASENTRPLKEKLTRNTKAA